MVTHIANVTLRQVATCRFLTSPFLAFVRLRTPVLLEDFCEISKPTRFLALVLGPQGTSAELLATGRALGTLLSDQLFCQVWTALHFTALHWVCS